MHGGAGVSDADYAKAIDAGIRKINYYTYGVKYAGEAVEGLVREKDGETVYWHDMTTTAYERMLADFTHVMQMGRGRWRRAGSRTTRTSAPMEMSSLEGYFRIRPVPACQACPTFSPML